MARRGRGISVHELAALRLNTRGERAAVPSSSTRKGKQVIGNLDGRGSIVTTSHPLASKKRPRSNDVLNGLEGTQSTEEDKLNEGEDSGENIAQRLRKKRKRYTYSSNLLPFLGEGTSAPGPLVLENVEHSNNNRIFAGEQPSSDLLKTIHHFASCYYDQRGLLKDISKSSRVSNPSPDDKSSSKPNKVNQKDEQQSGSEAEATSTNTGSGEESKVTGGETSSEATSTSQSDSLSEGHSNDSRKSGQRKTSRVKNMYRALDGSALVAIGMILHMHVQDLVARPPPSAEDWDRIMKEDEERFAKAKRRRESKGRPKKERPEIQIRSATHAPQDRNLDSDTDGDAGAGGDAGGPVHRQFEEKSTEEPAAPVDEIGNGSDLEDSDAESSSSGSESTDDSDSSEGNSSE